MNKPPVIPDDKPGVKIDLLSKKLGPFIIAPTNSKHGGFQASCPFHKLSDTSGCKKKISCRKLSLDHRKDVMRQLLWWCCRAKRYDRQRIHILAPFGLSDTPDASVVLVAKIKEGPSGTVYADDVLGRMPDPMPEDSDQSGDILPGPENDWGELSAPSE